MVLDRKLWLYFTERSRPTLSKTVFRFSAEYPEKENGGIRWRSGAKAFSAFLIDYVLHASAHPDSDFSQSAELGDHSHLHTLGNLLETLSAAQWILDCFIAPGNQKSGRLAISGEDVAGRIFRPKDGDYRSKSNAAHTDGWRRVRIQRSELPAACVRIFLDGKLLNKTADLEKLRATIIKQIDTTDGHPVPDAPSPPSPVRHRFIRIPFPPLGEKFAGRKKLIATLADELFRGGTIGPVQASVLRADPGVGKTALAIEVGWRLYEADQSLVVIFLDASSPQTLDTELASLCGRDALNLPEQGAPEQGFRRDAALAWLGQREHAEHTLVIFDSADIENSRAAVRRLLPRLRGCAVLITSRHRVWDSVRMHELDIFTPEEAREYLHTSLEPALRDPTGSAIEDVATALDHLPLALELVVSYLHETRQSPEEWLEEWCIRPAPTLAYYDRDAIRYPVSLERVWDQSVSRLSRPARELLNTLAFLAPRPAVFPLKPLHAAEDWLVRRALFAELAKASLLMWPNGKNAVSIHRILQTVTRHGLNDGEISTAIHAALALLDTAAPDPQWSEAGWQLWGSLEPSIQAVLDHARTENERSAATSLMNRYAHWLFLQGRFAEAEPLHRQALSIEEGNFRGDDAHLAPHLNNLAELLFVTSRTTEAEALFRRALAILQKHFGPNHPETIESVNHLAGVLHIRGHLRTSEQLRRRALAMAEIEFGLDHPKTARFLNNLAGQVGPTPEAEMLMRRALAIDKAVTNPNDLMGAGRLANFAVLLCSTARHGEAEPLARRALEVTEKNLGPDHHHVAPRLQVLAEALCGLGRLEEAEDLFRRSLEIREKTFSPDHPSVGQSLRRLAELALIRNEIARAERFARRALKIFLKSTMRKEVFNSSLTEAAQLYESILEKGGMSVRNIKKRAQSIIKEAERENTKAVTSAVPGGPTL